MEFTDNKSIHDHVVSTYNSRYPNEFNGYARKVVESFDLGSKRSREAFLRYYNMLDIEDFIMLLAVLKKTAWADVGETPVDKLNELESKVVSDPIYEDLPAELLINFLIDPNSIEEEEEEENSDEDVEEINYDLEPERYFIRDV